VVQFHGEAERAGSGLANGTLSFGGKMQSVHLPDLRLTVLTIQRLLFDPAEGAELVRQRGHAALLPLVLFPRPHSSATKAIYEIASGVGPKVRVEVKQRAPDKAEAEFLAVVERVTIDELPVCSGSQGAASLQTQMVLTSMAGSPPIAIATEQRWTCEDEALRTP